MKQSKPYVNCFGKVLKPKSTDRLFIYNFNYFWREGEGRGGERNNGLPMRAIKGGQTICKKCNKCAINGVE